tara:strand:+ start:68 stop:427 length:360 start_codon:yes stop_codon:yes gene_type:complete
MKGRTKIFNLDTKDAGNKIVIMGWVRTFRKSKNVSFVSLNDGSTINSLQVVLDMNNFDEKIIDNINTGSSLRVEGELVKSSGKNQKYELLADNIVILGESNPDTYPIQPKNIHLSFLEK